jgi:hypothetical protein
MFRKIVSNLAFSPALVGQLAFYAKRLKKEEATRRVGLIFTALALIVQSFAVFSPPESANASSPSNFIPGGVTSLSGYLSNYDANTNNIKDLFTVLGITRSDIVNTHAGQINSKGVYSWGLTSRFSYAQGERTYTIKTSSGGTRTFYTRPLSAWDTGSNVNTGSYYNAYIGTSSSGMWFALMKVCGNLVLKVIPPAPKCPTGTVGTYPDCTKPECPAGTVGTYPDCTAPKCPAGTVGTYPNCAKPTPVAKCESLKITKLLDNYQLDATGYVANGATISGYTYVIKRDGEVVQTITKTSTSTTYTATTTQTVKGTYTVELTVQTSLGNETSPDCTKTFSIPPPAMCPQNPSILLSSPECQPCPGDSTLWIKDEKCKASVILTKAASNITQGNVDAIKTTAKASDKIIYTLELANHGNAPAAVTPTELLDDVAEYATVIDAGGGSYNDTTKTLTWSAITLKPGEKQTRMFTVQVMGEIPAMGTGTSDRTSYDCKMINVFGNAVEINVDCPIQKQVVEQTVSQLPHTGPRENMLFAGIVLSIVVYFYARARQVKKEVRLIRRDLNAGTI